MSHVDLCLFLIEIFLLAVERYNRDSETWETCPSMAIKRGSLGGATVRDKIYALGGGNGAISFDDTECYDPIIGIWTSSSKMLERVFFSPMTVQRNPRYILLLSRSYIFHMFVSWIKSI